LIIFVMIVLINVGFR